MEFGAGTGKLAAGLLNALRELEAPLDSYSIVDLSGELRERQRATIEADAPELASKVKWLDALPADFEGVVIGNEVLDAMPVRLVVRKLGAWHERGVRGTGRALRLRRPTRLQRRPAGRDDRRRHRCQVNDEPFIEYVSGDA